jgi:hypothetical protein
VFLVLFSKLRRGVGKGEGRYYALEGWKGVREGVLLCDVCSVLFFREQLFNNLKIGFVSEVLKNKEVVSCVCRSHIHNFILYVYMAHVSNATGCTPQR